MIDIDKRYYLWTAYKIEEHAIKIIEALLYVVNILRELSKTDAIECKNYEIKEDKNE